MTDLSPPEELRDVGQHFEGIGRRWRQWLEEFGLRPDHRVLDAGCGVGRIAIPLTSYITTGSYEGFDVSRPMLEWCQQNITPRFPNFRFQHADVFNKRYNKKGRYTAAEYRFPYEDASFDFVYLLSVFTHMFPDDVDHYMSEIARVMKPGARSVITYFLLNDRTLEAIAERRTEPAFRHKRKGYRIDSRRMPEGAVALEEDRVRAMYDRYGLTIENAIEGRWSGIESQTGQDIVIASKLVSSVAG